MKRLLCIVGSMDAGGAETFLMKIYRNFNREKYQMDFCVAKQEKNFYEDEILSLGGKIHRITPKSKGLIQNFIDIKRIVKKNQYKYVLRISQHSLSALELLAAKFGGAKVLVFRSSNTNSGGGKLNLILHYIFRPISNLIVNVKIAPSTEAARYMFGNRIVKRGKFNLIKNGLDVKKFKYSEEARNAIRKELNAEDKFIIGHVGRFTKQKNHKFLLDIFKIFLSQNSNSILLLIGKGELEEEIRNYANKLEIGDNVIFYGVSDKVNKFYSAMDTFVFPSLFEGMPNTIIEAQTSGLECLVSNAITKECNITGKVKFKSLEDSAEDWSNEIKNNNEDRHGAERILYNESYDINLVVSDFEKVIFGKE